MTDYIKTHRYWLIALLITFAGCIAWQMSTWYFSDDYVYMYPVDDQLGDDGFWFAEYQVDYTPQLAVSSSIAHWKHVNGRLANIIYIWCQFLPRQLVNLLNGLLMGLMLLLLSRFAIAHNRCTIHRWFVVACILAFWLIPTWYDSMQSSVYQINYIWTTVITFLTLLLFNKSAETDAHASKRSQLAQTGLLCALAFASGWMHEGIAIPAISYMGFRFLFYKEWRKTHFAITILFAIAGLLMAVSPGTFNRLSTSNFMHFEILKHIFISILREFWPMYVAILSTLVVYIFLRKNKVCRRQFMLDILPYLVAALAGICVSLALLSLGRVLWGSKIFTAIVIVRCLSYLINSQSSPGKKSRLSSIFYYGALAIYALWFVQLVSWQKTFSAELKWLDNKLINSTESSVFYRNVHHNYDTPFYLCDIVAHHFYNHHFDIFTHTSVRTGCKNRYSCVLPDSLAGKTFNELPKIPGDNEFRGVYPEILSTELYDNAEAIITVGKPLPNYSPVQFLTSLVRDNKNPLNTETTYRVRLRPLIVTDNQYRKLIKYIPEVPSQYLKDREFVKLDELKKGRKINNFNVDSVIQINFHKE